MAILAMLHGQAARDTIYFVRGFKILTLFLLRFNSNIHDRIEGRLGIIFAVEQ